MDKDQFNTLTCGLALIGFLCLAAAVFALSGSPSPSPARAAPADCSLPPTPEPLWVDPVTSPTTLLTQTLRIALGRGCAITIASEAGIVMTTGTFFAHSPVSVTAPLLPNTTHHLGVYGLVEYEAGCFYTLSTARDRYGNLLTIVQVTSPTLYLPLVMRNLGVPVIAGCGVFPPDNPWNRDISDDPVHPKLGQLHR